MNTNIYRSLILCACLLATHNAPADGIEIISAASVLSGEAYQLDARIEFKFDSEMRDALEHGVSINIDVTVLIKRERNWLWDPKVKEEVLNFKLEQHPLSNRYLVTELGSDSKKQFPTLEEALDYLGTINDRLLISKSALAADENYIGMIRAKVNTETLPAVIRPAASASKKWQLDSPWFRWSIIKE